MKRKFITKVLFVTMISSILIGCDNNTTKKNTTETDTTNIVNETETTLSDVEESSDNSTETETVSNLTEDEIEALEAAGIYIFTDAVDGGGFMEEEVSTTEEGWSSYKVHYVNSYDDVMNFSWEAPQGMGKYAYSSTDGNTSLIIKNSTGEYTLRAFTSGTVDSEIYDATKSYDKETITSFVPLDLSYIENGYYDSNIGENVLGFIFAVEGTVSSEEVKGYAYFLMTRETGICYQFIYLEKGSVYDEERVRKVVESITPISSDELNIAEIEKYIVD